MDRKGLTLKALMEMEQAMVRDCSQRGGEHGTIPQQRREKPGKIRNPGRQGRGYKRLFLCDGNILSKNV